MSQGRDDTLTETVGLVDDFFARVFRALEAWQPALEAAVVPRIRSGSLTGSALAQLIEADALRVLADPELPIYGAGFCGAADAIQEGNPLAWWQGPGRSPLVSSSMVGEQLAVDYRRLEWFRFPERSGAGHVAGPYVDYLCSNEITITSALPLHVDGRFVGVTCVDVLVSSLEANLLPALERLGGDATLVNGGGRVVVSADPGAATGDTHEGVGPGRGLDQLGPGFRARASTRFPFAVIVADGT